MITAPTLPLRLVVATATTGLWLTVGCNDGANHSQRSAPPEAAASDDPRTDGDNDGDGDSYVSTAKFPLFDPAFNFLSLSQTNSELVRRDFPVLDGDDSPVAIVQLDDLLAVRWRMLNAATKSVRIQALIFFGDESGWLFADKLIELKKRGIDVRIAIDPIVNGLPETQRLYWYLEANRIPVEGYDPFYTWPSLYGKDKLTKDELITQGNQRYHEKFFIVDGEVPDRAIALTGGVNLSNEYFRIDSRDPFYMWRDQDIAVRGEAAMRIAQMFDRNFASMQALRGPETSPIVTLAATLPLLAKALGQDNLFGMERDSADPGVIAKFHQRAALTPQMTWHNPRKLRVLEHNPKTGLYTLEDAYVEMIKRSAATIDIANAYFIPSEAMIAELKAAIDRGVEIRILTNSTESSEIPVVAEASRTFYQRLLDLNAEGPGSLTLYEWQGDKVLKNGEGHLHSKYAVFDGEAYVVGSYNLDPRSRDWDTEDAVFALDDHGASDLTTIFADEISTRHSRIVTADDIRRFKKPSADLLQRLMQGLVPYLTPYL